MVEELMLLNSVRCLGYGNGFVIGLDDIDKTVTVILEESGVTIEVIEEDVMGIPIDENYLIDNYPFKPQGNGVYAFKGLSGDFVYDMSAKVLNWQGKRFSIEYRHTLENFFFHFGTEKEQQYLKHETDKDL